MFISDERATMTMMQPSRSQVAIWLPTNAVSTVKQHNLCSDPTSAFARYRCPPEVNPKRGIRDNKQYMYVCIHIYIYIYTCVSIYIYIYIHMYI